LLIKTDFFPVLDGEFIFFPLVKHDIEQLVGIFPVLIAE
jgi:hypothetical protein